MATSIPSLNFAHTGPTKNKGTYFFFFDKFRVAPRYAEAPRTFNRAAAVFAAVNSSSRAVVANDSELHCLANSLAGDRPVAG